MCPGEGEGPKGGSGDTGTGDIGGGGDFKSIIDYLNFRSFGVDGDFTGNGGYGGDNTGPVGSKDPTKDDYEAAPLPDTIGALPGQTFGPTSGRAGAPGLRREMDPYTGAHVPVGTLFPFIGQQVDPYSGVVLGMERLDPFTGTPVSDPFTASGPPTSVGRAASFGDSRRKSLLLSPNLIASNGPIACDSSLAECPPKMMSDANQSSMANQIQAEMDESYVTSLRGMEGTAQIAGSTRPDLHEASPAPSQSTSNVVGTGMWALRLAIQWGFAPVGSTGAPLTGPLQLYSGPIARQGAFAAVPGHTIAQTVYAPRADAAEAVLRARLGVGPTGMLPPDLYNPIWDRASRGAVIDATLSGLGVHSHNDVFNVVGLPPGQQLPAGSNALSSSSIQARVELPWLRGLGTGMGALMMGAGAFTIYGSAQTSQETQNPLPVMLGAVSGSLEVTGGLAYAIGALGAEGPMMAAGVAIADTGGILAVPLLALPVVQNELEIREWIQPTADRLREEGNWLGAALLNMPILPNGGL